MTNNLHQSLIEETEKSFQFLFDVQLGWLSPNDNVAFNDDDNSLIARRIKHTKNWCVDNQKPFYFYHVIFSGEDSDQIAPCRKFDFSLGDNRKLYLDISPTLPLSDSLFRSTVGSNMMNLISDALVITESESVDGRAPKIIYVNKTFEQMTGYQRNEVIGRTASLLQGNSTDSDAKAYIKGCLERWDNIQQTLTNYRKSGESFEVELNISPVKDDTGWYSHWISFQRDVSKTELNRKREIQRKLSVEASGIGTWTFNIDTRDQHPRRTSITWALSQP